MNKITYQVEQTVTVHEFIEVLKQSSLAERRPIDDFHRITSMLQHANLMVTARYESHLVGIARCITDWVYCSYLSDLAVDLRFQKQGIGKALIQRVKQETPDAKLILLSAPKAISFYERIGMKRHEHCFILDDIAELDL